MPLKMAALNLEKCVLCCVVLVEINGKNSGKMDRNEVFMKTERFSFMNLGRLRFRLWPNNRKPTKKLVPITTLLERGWITLLIITQKLNCKQWLLERGWITLLIIITQRLNCFSKQWLLERGWITLLIITQRLYCLWPRAKKMSHFDPFARNTL